ncbi:MAG: DEAD/DEAH box helicase [Bacteroidota bacterium]
MNYTKKRKAKNAANKKRVGRSPQPSKRRNAKARISQIDPAMLEKMEGTGGENVQQSATPSWSYATTNLHPAIKKNLEKQGYTHPTPVQEQCLEPAIKGQDILGVAGTGTGKTAAFLIPVIQRLHMHPKGTQTLVAVPTRELALQVAEEFENLASGTRFKAACFIGGRNIKTDLARLRKPSDVVIGTPGRLLDLYRQGALKFGGFTTFVLDEFDRMLDMGFMNDVQKILDALTNRQQTLFFSATVDKKQQRLIDEILVDPVKVMIEQQNKAADTVRQQLIRVAPGANKLDMLYDLINDEDFTKVLIFAETKRTVNQVSKKLSQRGIRSDVIHGNKSQNYRQKALAQFTAGKVQVLVATDVAARGLDVTNVSHVINYQLPQTMDSYIHRIGRTGRAGKQGQAFTFVDQSPN